MVEDCFCLAVGMHYKAAFHGLPLAGAKVCVQLAPGACRQKAFARLGRFVSRFGGSLKTTEDLGTTPEDMAIMHEFAPDAIWGLPVADSGSGDPSPYTAEGVLSSMRAVSRRVLGRGGSLAGLRVLVRGVGHVGGRVVQDLVQQGAAVFISDVRPERLEPFVSLPGVQVVAPADVVPVDVYCPCAKGGEVGPHFDMPVKAVCGAANNQLADDSAVQALARRGIVYVPDFAANGGGLISVAAEQLGKPREWVWQRVRDIGHRVEEVLAEAAARNATTLQVALEVCARNRNCRAA
jgi:leucine dehydrogenase